MNAIIEDEWAEQKRINAYQAAVEERASAADRLDKLEAQCTDLFRQLRNERDTSRAQAEVIAGMAAKIEEMQSRNEQQGRINQDTLQRFVSICQRLGKLEVAQVCNPIILEDHTKQIGTLQDAQIKTFARLDHHNIRLPTPDEQPTKRTIKVGWVNVYRGSYGNTIFSHHEDRVEADKRADTTNRIACIQIPDITEGEGL